MKRKFGNWETVKIRSSLRPLNITTMGLDFMLWISIFAATEFFFTETMIGNKLSNIKRFSLQKSFKQPKF